MLQIGGGNASKFEFLMLRILLWSFRFCLVFECRASNESRAAPKWKVPESFKNRSCDVLECSWVIFPPTIDWWPTSEQIAFFVIFESFLVATRMLQCCRGLNPMGASHLLLCKEHRGPNVEQIFGKSAFWWALVNFSSPAGGSRTTRVHSPHNEYSHDS